MMEKTDVQILELNWKSTHPLGAIAALLAVLFAMLEILITFIPGGERVSPELLTVPLWFERLQANPLLELRNLGLVNIFLTTFGLLLSFALFAAHRKVNPGWAGLTLVISLLMVWVMLRGGLALPGQPVVHRPARLFLEALRGGRIVPAGGFRCHPGHGIGHAGSAGRA